ncbi:AAA family ATPase [Crocinitomicaceae bacterium]|jgi:SpoVK/Ycf46/Vps4 family AAA+-type ATPase|nr:AAA family ATPase [Crocinitomicaceae bacterium]
MSNPKNPNKNTDPSNNNNINLIITNDPSKNIIKNPFILPLQDSKENKTTKANEVSTDNKKTDINSNTVLFTMKMNNILDELRKNREKNKNKNDKNNKIFSQSLDLTFKDLEDPSKNLSLVPFTKLKSKEDINDIINKIHNSYNFIYNKDASTNNVKSVIKPKRIFKNTGMQFPPPPLPNKFDSLFIQGKNIRSKSLNDKTNVNQVNWAPGESWSNWDKKWSPPRAKFPPPPPPLSIKKTKVVIEREINGLKDLLKLIEDFPLKVDIEYNINMKAIHDIKAPLTELDNMIGMQKLKDSIIDQVIFFSQELHKDNDFMHTVIYGPPGTGKTEIAKIMGKIFSCIGVLKNNKFRKVTRADLIAGYLGQTAIKTRDVIADCLGGVLFIDEAYALGNREKRDSFAKECIDTLCEGLSDHKDKLMVIIAGYEDDLNKCFFSYNQGLNSRFPWRFHTDDYKATELNLIFQKKVKEIGWSLKKNTPDSWFESKMEYFKYFGRDIETLLAKTKIAHGRRVFCKSQDEKRVLTIKDLDKGFDMFIDNNEVKDRKDKSQSIIQHMYV